MGGLRRARDVQRRRTAGSPTGREPYGDGVPVVVAGVTTCQGGRESRATGRRGTGDRAVQRWEVCGMQNAEPVLDVIRARHRARADVITGEQGAGKLACSVREGADGKGPRLGVPRRRPTSLCRRAGGGDASRLVNGNGRNSGQVLLGNTVRPEALRRSFIPTDGTCEALPSPSLQRPDLLDAPPERQPQPDCAEAIADGVQGPTINQIVASIAASYVEKLLAGTCRWMASYFDFDDGTLRCLPADPKLVADIAGLHPNAVAPPAARR